LLLNFEDLFLFYSDENEIQRAFMLFLSSFFLTTFLWFPPSQRLDLPLLRMQVFLLCDLVKSVTPFLSSILDPTRLCTSQRYSVCLITVRYRSVVWETCPAFFISAFPPPYHFSVSQPEVVPEGYSLGVSPLSLR